MYVTIADKKCQLPALTLAKIKTNFLRIIINIVQLKNAMSALLRHIRLVPSPFLNAQRHINLTAPSRCLQSNTISGRYQNLMKTRPFLLQAVQAGVLMGVGDFIAQTYIEKKPLQDVNYGRTLRFTALGFAFVVNQVFERCPLENNCNLYCLYRVQPFAVGTVCSTNG